METNQERAFRFIYEDYDSSYENLLENSKLPSLKIRRIKAIASETFKIIHKMYFCKAWHCSNSAYACNPG